MIAFYSSTTLGSIKLREILQLLPHERVNNVMELDSLVGLFANQTGKLYLLSKLDHSLAVCLKQPILAPALYLKCGSYTWKEFTGSPVEFFCVSLYHGDAISAAEPCGVSVDSDFFAHSVAPILHIKTWLNVKILAKATRYRLIPLWSILACRVQGSLCL